MCKDNCEGGCVKQKVNLHAICFQILTAIEMFDRGSKMQGSQIYELVLFNNIFVQLF